MLALAACLPGIAWAQVSPSFYDYARPGLDWYKIETEHFDILFHTDEEGTGNSRTAQVVARIAEDIYEPITGLYGYEPGRVSIILKDYEDYSNGAAYFFDNKIEIWSPALDSPLRGDHNWLRNVITHEFTHIVQVQTTMKASRQMPFLYLQVLDYEDVRRPDVLYGYPNVLITYPVPVLSNPAWLAEGTAQYQRAWLDYDRWDTHRDMLLRTRVLAGEELDLTGMGGFHSKTSLMREGVYNHGFAFTQYLANTYGEDALREISRSLGKWRNWNVERAIGDALGVPAKEVYRAWMGTLRQEYEARTAEIRSHLVEGELLEPDGFSNFYPAFSPDGRRLAYVSNKGEDFSRMALYVRDLETGASTAFWLEGLEQDAFIQICALGHKLRSEVGGTVSWHPDGGAVVYTRRKDTREGYLYADLYRMDLETEKETRLTTDQRATMPAYAPDGRSIAFVGHNDGTTNLFLLDLETNASTQVTAFNDGSQVSDPAWQPDGAWIYFALLTPDRHGRDLYRIRPDGSSLEPVRTADADERSPTFDPLGRHLYFASDKSGIFNLYRVAVDDAGAEAERLTNVVGGAFMPAVSRDGALAYAHYQWDGYKIGYFASMPEVPAPARLASYVPPPITQKQEGLAQASAERDHLNRFDDTDLQPLAVEAIATVRTEGSFPLTPGTDGEPTTPLDEPLEVEKYGTDFTSFSFFPTIRLDQYVSRQRSRLDTRLPDRTRGETLARNTKIGAYASSREILEGLTLFGGLLIGPASEDASSVGDFFSPSRLLDLERDGFLQFEYKKGLGLLPERWSPQFTVELFNVRRNVDNGLSIEEFPCTACFPDTTQANISYSLWEADIFVRSKVNRALLLEAGYRYSPYRVTTDRFFSKEAAASIPESSSRYFIGRAFTAKAYFEAFRPYKDADVLPEGLRVDLGYEYELGRLLDSFEIEDGLLVPAYQRDRNHRVTLDVHYGQRLGRLQGGAHGFGLRARGSSILGSPVDDFYNDYVGGLIGARGYPFYALGGNETLWFQASYIFPIVSEVERQVLFTYIDKVYARVYADAAAAWSGAWPGFEAFRKDLGAELRLGMTSFYLLPTAVFVSATYGFDEFNFELDEGFLTPDGSDFVRYGNELQWHFGVLFEFDL